MFAGSNHTCVLLCQGLNNRRVLFVLYTQVTEVLHDVRFDGQLIRVLNRFLTVYHYISKYLYRTV